MTWVRVGSCCETQRETRDEDTLWSSALEKELKHRTSLHKAWH